jgi:hypothetical protein
MRAGKLLTTMILAPLALAACGDSVTGGSGNGDTAPVSIRFGVSAGAARNAAPLGALRQEAQGDQLVVTGANGTLTITDIRMIVAEFEVKGDDDVNPCGANGGGDDCEDFEAGPLFIDLPLAGSTVPVSTGEIPPGTYREVEFEVEDLDDDEENAAERQRIEALLAQVRAQFADWPRDASMLVTGTFTPTGGQPRAFRVFIEAEIEVEVDLNPPLVITETSTSRDVSILLDPAAIFRSGNNVLDLSQSTGRLLEIEIENGFSGRGGSNSGQG